MRLRSGLRGAGLALALAGAGPAGAAPAPAWSTHAERTHYRETGTYDEAIAFCRRLERASPWVKLLSFGTSGQGRDLPLVVLSKDRAFTPRKALGLGKPVVLIENAIHAGEIEGKDAVLALMRDIAVTRQRAAAVARHDRRDLRLAAHGPLRRGGAAVPRLRAGVRRRVV